MRLVQLKGSRERDGKFPAVGREQEAPGLGAAEGAVPRELEGGGAGVGDAAVDGEIAQKL
jgi:hypothetical protein